MLYGYGVHPKTIYYSWEKVSAGLYPDQDSQIKNYSLFFGNAVQFPTCPTK